MASLREEIEKRLANFVGSPAHTVFILSQLRPIAHQVCEDQVRYGRDRVGGIGGDH